MSLSSLFGLFCFATLMFRCALTVSSASRQQAAPRCRNLLEIFWMWRQKIGSHIQLLHSKALSRLSLFAWNIWKLFSDPLLWSRTQGSIQCEIWSLKPINMKRPALIFMIACYPVFKPLSSLYATVYSWVCYALANITMRLNLTLWSSSEPVVKWAIMWSISPSYSQDQWNSLIFTAYKSQIR